MVSDKETFEWTGRKQGKEKYGIWGRSIPVKGTGKCKGPEVGAHLACFRSEKYKKAHVTEVT